MSSTFSFPRKVWYNEIDLWGNDYNIITQQVSSSEGEWLILEKNFKNTIIKIKNKLLVLRLKY